MKLPDNKLQLASLRLLSQKVSEVVLLLDPSFLILEASGAVGALFNVAGQELRGEDFRALLAPDDRQRVEAAARRAARGEEVHLTVHPRLGTPEAIALLWSAADLAGYRCWVVRCRGGSAPQAGSMLPAEQLIGVGGGGPAPSGRVLISQLGHEIRTQLTGIVGFAEVLAHELTGRQGEAARIIERSGKRLLNTINQMLTLSRLDAGQMRLQPEPVDVTAEVAEEVQLLLHLAEEKGLGVHVRQPIVPILATLDRAAFRRILENLLSNAIKYTERGKIEIGIGVEGRQLHLSIRDTGIGISPEFLPHVFDEFTRQASGFAGSDEGSGLGLAITRRLVEMMGGRIMVTSRPGEGTAFDVHLPLEPTPVIPSYEDR